MEKPVFPKCFKRSSKPHKFCPGCGHPIILKMLGEVIDEMGVSKKIVFLVDIGCSLLAWDFFDLATSQTHHGRTVPVAVGFKKIDPSKIVIAYMGDGGAYAIGLQHTISACLRNDPVTTIVANNTVYGMTGGQMAPTTMEKEITTTTPGGRENESVIHGPELLATIAKPGSFIARGTTDQPLVLRSLIKKSLEAQINNKYSFLEVLSACPTNWKTDAKRTIENMKLLAQSFPLGEFCESKI